MKQTKKRGFHLYHKKITSELYPITKNKHASVYEDALKAQKARELKQKQSVCKHTPVRRDDHKVCWKCDLVI